MRINRRNLLLGIPAAALAGAMGKTKTWEWHPYKKSFYVAYGKTMSRDEIKKEFSEVVGETLIKHQKDFYDSVNAQSALFKRLMKRSS